MCLKQYGCDMSVCAEQRMDCVQCRCTAKLYQSAATWRQASGCFGSFFVFHGHAFCQSLLAEFGLFRLSLGVCMQRVAWCVKRIIGVCVALGCGTKQTYCEECLVFRLCTHVHFRFCSIGHSLAMLSLSCCCGLILCCFVRRIMAVSVMATHAVKSQQCYLQGMK